MKRSLCAILVVVSLSGCSSLNVSWSLTASYNSNVNAVTQARHMTSPENGRK